MQEIWWFPVLQYKSNYIKERPDRQTINRHINNFVISIEMYCILKIINNLMQYNNKRTK